MVSLLDIGLVSQLGGIFSFIFVWVVVFAVLSYTKILGDKKNLYSIIAVAIALLTIFTPSVLAIIQVVIPWLTFLMIMLVFLVLILLSIGFNMEHVTSTLRSKNWSNTIVIFIIVIVAIIVLSGIGQTFFNPEKQAEQQQTETVVDPATGVTTRGDVGSEGSGALFATIFHPKVLSLILIMLIAVVAMAQLGKGSFIE